MRAAHDLITDRCGILWGRPTSSIGRLSADDDDDDPTMLVQLYRGFLGYSQLHAFGSSTWNVISSCMREDDLTD